MKITENIFLNATTGAEEINKNYRVTEYIAVDGTYTVRPFEYLNNGNARIRVYLYDSNKVFIRREVVKPESYPRGYSFTNTGYVRINIDNTTTAYEDPYKYILVKGVNIDNVATTFYPYLTGVDLTARKQIETLGSINDIENLVNNAIQSKTIINYGIDYTFSSLDDAADNSIYYVGPSRITTNYPLSTAAYALTISLSSRNKLQILYDAYGNAGVVRGCVNGTWNLFKIISIGNDSSSQNAYNYSPSSSIAIFQTIGCCGDSFTAGYLYNKTSSDFYDPNYVPNGEYANCGYPAVLGRLYGINVSSYSKGGLTTGTFITDSNGLPALLNDTAKQLYIIALGLNDKTQNVPIGVEADIDTRPAEETFLGNYGYIIRQILQHAPNSRIIMVKSLWVCNAGSTTPNSYYNYISQGVELLSSHLSIPYIETLDDPYFCSDQYINGLKGLHPTAPLYAGIAKRISELIGDCILNNPDYFYNFYIPN